MLPDIRHHHVRKAALRGEKADCSDLCLNEVEAAIAEYAAALRRSYMMDVDEAITKATPRIFAEFAHK